MKFKILSIFLVAMMLIANIATVNAADANFQGEGTVESPFLINNADDLVKLSNLTNASATAEYATKYYKLTQDIDMTGVEYTAISYAHDMYVAQGKAFSGTLDGNNHIIKNITFKTVNQYGATYGIIGYLSTGTVKNLGVENVNVSAGATNRICVGGIAGSIGGGMTIENSYTRGMTVTSTTSEPAYVGGIAGRTIGGSGLIKNCYAVNLSFGGVSRADLKAGILGSSGNTAYTAQNCYTTDAKIQGNTSDTNSYMGTTNCYALSTIANATVANLGDAYKAAPENKNSGYPVLKWEFGGVTPEPEPEPEDTYFEGEGTVESPFLISTPADLVQLSNLTNASATAEYATKYYKLTQDIDMTGVAYKPVSYASNFSTVQGKAFSGTLDGNNHIIKNITFANIAQYGATYGIIGYLLGGTVKNLGVENMTVSGGSSNRLCIGGIAGSLGAGMTIENSYVRGMTVTSTTSEPAYVGGIAGRTIGNSGTIKNCYAVILDFSGVARADLKAGILGSSGNTAYTAQNCYTTDAKIQGNTSDTNSYMGTTNCYALSTIANATATALGGAYKLNPTLKNEGYPLLSWESHEGYELKPKASLELPALISDHMLIQQNKPIKLWGNAEAGEIVTVELKNGDEVLRQAQVTVSESGRFDVELPQIAAGGPYTLTFATQEQTVTVSDVLVGDLWVQGGQSNMARATSGTGSYANGILPQEANNEIRLFMATADISALVPATDLAGEWKIADPTSVNAYSAVGYVALEKLNDELNLPVGGICNAIGGASMSQFMGVSNVAAGEYYNSKTAPLTQFNIKGVMWYQGEGDRGRTPSDFTSTFNKLIETWRAGWNDTDLPFVYVALPPSPMKYYASWTGGYILEDFSSARLGQLQSYFENENVAIAVAMDCPPNLGEDSLHPNNKKPIGERLGLAALDIIYDVIDNGISPLYKSAEVSGNSVVVTFSHAYNGLKTTDNEAPRCFYVSDSENGTYYQADAVISGKNKVTLTCDEIAEIRYVSYAAEKHMYPYTSADDAVINTYADVNLVNSENLPLCPFNYAVTDVRTDINSEDIENPGGGTTPEPEPEDAYFEGEGTVGSPFLISTPADLVQLATLTNDASTAETYASKYYKLTQDIDMTGVEYTAISYAHDMYVAQGKAFSGTLDGNNHIIKNITFKTVNQYGATYGIIGYLSTGTVKNLGVENVNVSAGATNRICVGGIAGSIGGGMTIENSYTRGMTVTTTSTEATYVGGIAGRTIGNSGVIKNSYAITLDFSTVTNKNTVAGILGSSGNTGYSAENCYTTHSKVQGDTAATNSYMSVTNCYVAATITNATASTLGNAYKENPTVKNEGYPLLSWESHEGYELKPTPDPDAPQPDLDDPNFEGNGTAESPFLINNATDLVKLASLTNDVLTAEVYASKYYKLTQNLDMTGVEYTPISYAHSMTTAVGKAFSGTFDGNNHVIKNITVKTVAQYGATYGIIGLLSGGTVKNLGVENMTVNGGATNRICVGGIAGSLGTEMTIENSYTRGMTVTSTSTDATYVGGIAGRTIGNSGAIKNCYAVTLDFSGVSRSDLKAGILGSCGNTAYSAQNCYTTDAKVQGNVSVANANMVATNCYASSTLKNMTAAILGEAFDEDTDLLNNELPVLVWEYDIAHSEIAYFTLKSGDVEITNNALNISVENPFVITFDRDMNTETFSKNIKVLKNGAEITDFEFEKTARTFTIKLDNEYNTHYTVWVSKYVQSVKDENGKSARADEKSVTFTTVQLPKAVEASDILINGQATAPENLTAGSDVVVEAVVENVSEESTQSVALVVTVFGKDGIMKYAALDTVVLGSDNETLKVDFDLPDDVGENPIINVMIWDSIKSMNSMGQSY